jgi:O-antigen ligase
MAIFKSVLNTNPLVLARFFVIFDLVAILFSPPVSTFSEIALLVIFLTSSPVRLKILAATKQPLVKASLVFYLVISIATLWSEGPVSETFGMWWGWRKLLLIPIVVGVFDEELWKDRLIITLIVVTTLCAFLSWFGWLFEYSFYKYAVGIVIKNHAMQGMIFSVAAFAAAILLRELTVVRSYKFLGLLVSILILISNVLYVTPGRSGYIAFLILAMIFIWTSISGKQRYWGSAIAILLLGILLYSSTTARNRIYQAYNEFVNYQQTQEYSSIGIRVIMLKKTYNIIMERPLFGHGTGGYTEAYRHQITQDETGWRAQVSSDPHNQYLTVTAEQGIFGLIVFLAFIFSAFFQKETGKYRILGLAILLVWCATSLFSSHFSTYSEGRFLYLWCGAMLALRSSPLNHEIKPFQ